MWASSSAACSSFSALVYVFWRGRGVLGGNTGRRGVRWEYGEEGG